MFSINNYKDAYRGRNVARKLKQNVRLNFTDINCFELFNQELSQMSVLV